jgi:hypothetical protein
MHRKTGVIHKVEHQMCYTRNNDHHINRKKSNYQRSKISIIYVSHQHTQQLDHSYYTSICIKNNAISYRFSLDNQSLYFLHRVIQHPITHSLHIIVHPTHNLFPCMDENRYAVFKFSYKKNWPKEKKISTNILRKINI